MNHLSRRFTFCLNTFFALTLSLTPAFAESANTSLPEKQQSAVTPEQLSLQKALPQLYRLFPALKEYSIEMVGAVDGPGMSGVAIHFHVKGKDQPEAAEAIVDYETGALLQFDATPTLWKTSLKTPNEATAKTQAYSFVRLVHSNGSQYQVKSIKAEQTEATVTLVRMINGIQLPDQYDAFVTLDEAGHVLKFRTINGKFYEKLDTASFPAAKNILSKEAAIHKYIATEPLQLSYLIPSVDGQKPIEQPVTSKLLYTLKGGILRHFPTYGAIDAFTGSPVVTEKKAAESQITVNGAGAELGARSVNEGQALLKQAFNADVTGLPVVTYEDDSGNGHKSRFTIWGYFDQKTADNEKRFQLDQFPESLQEEAKKVHYMLETDALTGKLRSYQFVHSLSDFRLEKNTNIQRDTAVLNNFLQRYLPSGQQARLQDIGSEDEHYFLVDPIKNGVLVYPENLSEEDGGYTVAIDSYTGKIKQVAVHYDPSNVLFPEPQKAISAEEAVSALLSTYPLELYYAPIHNMEQDKTEWKLIYDLSFRKTRSHCFCGLEEKLDIAVHVDAQTGNVITVEQ